MRNLRIVLSDRYMILRPINDSHLDYIRNLRNTPDNMSYFKTQEFITREGHQAWYDLYKDRIEHEVLWVVEMRNETKDGPGTIVGTLGLSLVNQMPKTAEIGRIIIENQYRRQGLMKYACSKAIKFCSDTLGLDKMILFVGENNVAARCLYDELGFRAISPDHSFILMELSLS